MSACSSGVSVHAATSRQRQTPAVAPKPTSVTSSPGPTGVAPSPAQPTVLSHPVPTTTRSTQEARPYPESARCPTNLAELLAWTGSATRLVTVEAAGYRTDAATVTLWQRSGVCWSPVGGPWSGYLGTNGFSDHKREGDGATPTGAYHFGPVVYGNQANPGINGSYHRLLCGDWWDSDPASSLYNTFQHVTCGIAPSWGPRSEALWTETGAYPSFAVIDYNTDPVVAGAGSAIFLHASTGGATAGCVSIPVDDLDRLLRWLQPQGSSLIAMGPANEITKF